MLKMTVFVYRKPGVSHEEFETYWKEKHAPLVKQYSRLLKFKKYVQSYNRSSPETDEFARIRGWLKPCDALAEVWWESKADMEAGLSTPEAQAASKALAADEAKFCDETRMSALLTEENVIFDYK